MPDDEEELLRTAAMRNAGAILQARQRAEQELVRAKEELERRSEELARSLAMARATLESTWDGILVANAGAVVTDFNQRFLEMWGLAPDAVTGQPHARVAAAVAPLLADPPRFLDRLAAIYGATEDSSDVLELSDGRIFQRYSRLQQVGGRNAGRVWSFRDVTERRRAEEALRQSAEERRELLESERHARTEAERANAMKDEFLATLSHELRTPLGSILGWSTILRTRRMSETELHEGLEVIERNARMQAQLIEDLLDMSRITSGKMRLDVQPVDPIVFIEAAVETVRPAAEAKGIRLRKVLDPRAGPINGDPDRLQQVVWNLLSNAIKFTGRGGQAEIALARVSSHVEIAVADTGCGIDPDFLPHVFDRFRQAGASHTRSTKGLGLGLAIVKNLVELHGGTVHVASPGEGRGSTFTVRLPVTVVHREPGAGPRVHPTGRASTGLDLVRPDLSGITVLVVDDQPDARDLIQRVLEDCAAKVLTASTADDAIRIVELERPDVLVSDIGLPGVDGYELLRQVRALGQARGGRLPAVALTAFARSEDRTRALRAGYLVHVSKPVEPSELIATVASVVGRIGDPA